MCVCVCVYLGVHGDYRGSSPSDSLVAPMWSFAGRKWPRIPPVGQTPPGKGPAPSTSGEETSVKLSLSCCQSGVAGFLRLWAVKVEKRGSLEIRIYVRLCSCVSAKSNGSSNPPLTSFLLQQLLLHSILCGFFLI